MECYSGTASWVAFPEVWDYFSCITRFDDHGPAWREVKWRPDGPGTAVREAGRRRVNPGTTILEAYGRQVDPGKSFRAA